MFISYRSAATEYSSLCVPTPEHLVVYFSVREVFSVSVVGIQYNMEQVSV